MNLLFLLIFTIFNRCELICLDSYHSCGKDDSFKCVPKAWVCDNNRDCYDGSDELNCPPFKCENNEFKCVESDECVSNSRLCDGISDCLDNSDEKHCTIFRKKCNDITEYDCENKLKVECIPIEEVCKNQINCSTKKDSKENCKIDMCRKNGIKKCSHSCINKYSSFACGCPLGMILGQDQKTCIHFNICLEKPNICSQECEEISTGYKCTCLEGYSKQGSRCELNNPNATIYLLFSSLNNIYSVPILSEESKNSILYKKITISPNNVISFDVKYEENMEIYSSLVGTPNGISINQFLDWPSYFNNPLKNNNKINIIDKKLNNITFYSTALDSARNLLFYTDLSSRSISVMNISSSDTVKIIETDCFYPINIVIDPISLQIYWIDLGEENVGPRIQMANMDGSSRHTVISTNLHKPTSLAIDVEDHRLYWSDHFPPTIQFLDLKSIKDDEIVKTTIVLERYLFQPFSLYIFENRVYWSDWLQNRIYSAHKTSGKGVVMIHRSNRPMNIRIISRVLNNQLIEKVNNLQISKSCSGRNNMCPYSCLPMLNSQLPKCFGSLTNHPAKYSSKNSGNSRLWFVLIPIVLLTLISVVLVKHRYYKTRVPQQNSNGNVYIYDNVKFWEEDPNSIQNENEAVNVSDALPIINHTY